MPVINALDTNAHDPCQALADCLTLREHFGSLQGLQVAYVGDGQQRGALAVDGRRAGGMDAAVARPRATGWRRAGRDPDRGTIRADAVNDAHAVYTDVWISMGDEETAAQRRADLEAYQLNEELMAAASERAIALHCLPAHPGEEITEAVLYGERSAVWDQAENRLHAQKALLELLVG